MGFKDELLDFNTSFEHLEIPTLPICEEDVLTALVVLNFIDYKKVPDIFLACAAMNLLNAYAKTSSSKIGYQYKRHLIEVIKGIEDVNQPKSILIGYDNTDNMQLLIVQFWSFQFSFQAQRLSGIVKQLLSRQVIEWDGIKKQPQAKAIFDFAFSRSWISDKTMFGADLHNFVEAEIQNFRRGNYSFEDGKLRKTANITYGSDMVDLFLKNYMRTKLLACTERPVILSAIYRKTWDKHITFTSVRPYIQGIKTITICDHINLKRTDVERVIDISDLIYGKRYYIIGFCEKYPKNERMGVRLATEYSFVPIFKIGDYRAFPKDILASCHRFSIEENIRDDQLAYTL